MKRFKNFLLFALLSTCSLNVFSQEEENEFPVPVHHDIILPGKGHINVEKLKGHIDPNMDISHLSLSELRVLRNAFAARQGYAFSASDLRSIFSTTTWYDSIMMSRFENEDEAISKYLETHHLEDWNNPEARKYVAQKFPYRYSKEQLSFINRIKARETELMKNNFNKPGGLVNTDNLINPFMLDPFDAVLLTKLAGTGFAIVPAQHNQLFHVYEKNDYVDFPSFITTDAYLQLYHMYFDACMRDIEENIFIKKLTVLSQSGYKYFTTQLQRTDNPKQIINDLEWCQAYFAEAVALLTGEMPEVNDTWKDIINEENQKIMDAENTNSHFMGPYYTGAPGTVTFAYSLFRPRGHYSRSKAAASYFRAMMWLQTVPMGTDIPEQVRRAILLSEAIGGDATVRKDYLDIFTPITYLMGAPDNITILQVYDEWKKINGNITRSKDLKKITAAIEKTADKQTRIVPEFLHTSRYKINLMPQRYQPDAEILSKMVDNKSYISQRSCPKGLDFFAAMGVPEAERILLSELKENSAWSAYSDSLQKARIIAASTDWKETAATQWMETLKTINDTCSRYPYFMQTQAWQKKNLNTSLASWAELKHDAILYAKQPTGAECGDGGPEPPVVKGYVEPNIKFWNKAIALMKTTSGIYKQYNLETEKVKATTERVLETAEFCRNISEKELKGIEPSNEEYKDIEIFGSTLENISLDLVRDKDQFLQGWDDVESADKKISVVADVYTASGDNVLDDKRCILYEGTGPAYEIYVVVEIGGYLYLTRGAVLSYREFQRPLSEPRMTDEEWQERLKSHPQGGTPKWMEQITHPGKCMDNDNEEVFYSSGC